MPTDRDAAALGLGLRRPACTQVGEILTRSVDTGLPAGPLLVRHLKEKAVPRRDLQDCSASGFAYFGPF